MEAGHRVEGSLWVAVAEAGVAEGVVVSPAAGEVSVVGEAVEAGNYSNSFN